jgi:glycogen operon protein
MFNAGPKAVKFKVCDPMESKKWVRAVDTSLPSPNDIMTPGTEVPLENPNVYNVKDRSLVILISRMLY